MNTFVSRALLIVLLPLAALSAAPVETSGLIAEGTRWETAWHLIDSGIDGPTVLVTGGLHGDEPSGFRAADQIRNWPVTSGCLIVIPAVNVPGLREGTRYLPGEPQERRDLNRNFPSLEKPGETRGELAEALWRFVREHEPKWVIDLHEGHDFRISHQPPPGKKPSVGSSVIHPPADELLPLVEKMLEAANAHVTDPDKKFVPIRGPIDGSLARASTRELGAHGFILETTDKDQPLSLRNREHRAMAAVILQHTGVVQGDCSSIVGPGRESSLIQAGFFDGAGTGGGGMVHIPRIIDEAADMEVRFLGAEDFRPEILAQLDVLIFPGGSGSKQAGALGEEGRELVRAFIREGGGYVGVCGGAYLCSSHYSWSLNLVDASVFTGVAEIPGKGRKQLWYRGEGAQIDMELTPAGKQLFGDIPLKFEVRYHNGPIVSPAELPDLEDYTPLAWFRSEQMRWEPQRGTMVNTPAIVCNRFGEGRVLAISPHPESDTHLEPIIAESIRWVAGVKEVELSAE